MRTIKFEYGFNSISGIVKKVYHLHEIPFISTKCDCWNILPIAYVRQFTGLTDKNGVEIYDGDIVHFRANYSSKTCGYMDGQVVFEENQWMLKNKNGLYSISEETDEFYCKSEVIGNIYQNETKDQ